MWWTFVGAVGASSTAAQLMEFAEGWNINWQHFYDQNQEIIKLLKEIRDEREVQKN